MCQSEAARWLKDQVQRNIFNSEYVGDDHVIPDFVLVPHNIEFILFSLDQQRHYAEDRLGYHIDPINGLLFDAIHSLPDSKFIYHEEDTQAMTRFVGDTVGDILPPHIKNTTNHWAFGITQHVVNLMGMENMFVAMMDEPEAFHTLMRRITDDMKTFLRWQENKGLILLNNGNVYIGSGSYCFTDELPQPGFDGMTRSTDTWGHLNS